MIRAHRFEEFGKRDAEEAELKTGASSTFCKVQVLVTTRRRYSTSHVVGKCSSGVSGLFVSSDKHVPAVLPSL